MALRTSSSAVGASAISPLRTPRERDWPSPMILRTPAALTSPTAAQIFEVPISRPTMNEEGSNIASPSDDLGFAFGNDRLCGSLDKLRRNVVRNRQVERGDAFAASLGLLVNFVPATE